MSIKSWKKGFMKKHCPFATEVIFDFPRFAAAHCRYRKVRFTNQFAPIRIMFSEFWISGPHRPIKIKKIHNKKKKKIAWEWESP